MTALQIHPNPLTEDHREHNLHAKGLITCARKTRTMELRETHEAIKEDDGEFHIKLWKPDLSAPSSDDEDFLRSLRIKT